MLQSKSDAMSVMSVASMPLTNPEAYAETLGHTEYQIRNFIINNKDFPTEDMKHRQCMVELWARFNAANEAKYRGDILEQDIIILKAKLVKDDAVIARAEDRKLEIEIAYKETSLKILRTDYENRILREAATFADMLSQYKASDGDRLEIEKENWIAKAQNNPDIKRLLGGL